MKDLSIQFDNKHLLVKTIQQNDHSNKINISASNNISYQTYHSLDWLVTVPETNKATRKIRFKMVGSPPLMMQK